MKTKLSLFISITACHLMPTTNIIGQEFKVRMADTPLPHYIIPSSTSNNTYYYTEPIKIEQTVQQNSVTETRVIGYYEDGYGANTQWLTISLKLLITTDAYGKDEIKVKAYKNSTSDYWQDVSYCTVSRTYGNIAKEFAYQVYVVGKTVYFTI